MTKLLDLWSIIRAITDEHPIFTNRFHNIGFTLDLATKVCLLFQNYQAFFFLEKMGGVIIFRITTEVALMALLV